MLMGQTTKTEAEIEKEKPDETAIGRGETEISEPTSPPRMEEQSSTLPKLATIKAILISIEAPPQVWPKEALKAILRRYERMPRNGWDLLHRTYTEKFATEISLFEFKRQAESAVVTSNGRKCSRQIFTEEKNKRQKSIKDFIEENTLSDLKLYTKVRDQFRKELAGIKTMKVEDVPRTKKIYSESQDVLVLDLLNQAIGEVIQTNPIKSWNDIAHMFQAAQLAYQAVNFKQREKSNWKENIMNKVHSASNSLEILIKARDSSLLPGEELSKGRKIMRQLGLILERKDDVVDAISRLTEKAALYQRKLDTHSKRKEFGQANRKYELQRSQFYRDLGGGDGKTLVDIEEEKVITFWSSMWNSTESESKDYSEYLREVVPDDTTSLDYFPSYSEYIDIIKFLPSWKAAGCDGIFNFFIKKCTSLHSSMYLLTRDTCMGKELNEDWFFKGITYLLPKGIPMQGSDFRPITCMSNLYKLTTKCVTKVMQLIVERRGLLSENQLGTVRQVQGAKEQAIINLAINKASGNNLKTTWIDVKKAFDSVDHSYLIECIKMLNFPPWIYPFLKSTISKWKIDIKLNNKTILEKSIQKGILQGDSLSPLLFVLCMDPLSRKLNSVYPKIAIKMETEQYVSNHLLFIDDLKLYSEKEDIMKKMCDETEKFFCVVGLERNRAKSATNCDACESIAMPLNANEGYKYLGILENRRSEVAKETYEKMQAEIFKRVESVCRSCLNGKNTIKAINEYALSVINYYIGAIPMEHDDYLKIDEGVRKILVKHKVHLQPANTERLYLPRKELGRGLGNIVHRSERMELQLFNLLNDSKSTSLRRAAILKVMQDENASTALIVPYLKIRYNMEQEVTMKALEEAQKSFLYSEIKNKTRHEKLYRAKSNEMVDFETSALWLTRGNISAKDEAHLCYLQDRNLFGGAPGICPHCKERPKSVDHLATQCNRMLGHDYTRRHNEVVKCIHLFLCNKYGIKRSKRLRTHSVQEISANADVEIRVDTTVATSTKISANRPDLIIHDKKKKEIIFIEVGITSQDQLTIVENEKRRKYDVLANEMGAMHNCRTRIIPYVITWDGIVTKFHKSYAKEIGLTTKIESYIQFIVLKKTLESISFSYRRDGEETEQDMLEIVSVLAKESDCNLPEVNVSVKAEISEQ